MSQYQETIPAHPETKAETAISIRGLYKSFGSNKVLQDFNLDVMKGERLVVLGKSGSGKSVLIKCIIGLLFPDSGTIQMFGRNIPDLNSTELDRIRIKVGFLFQSNALYDSMTVRENLEFPLRRHSIHLVQAEVDDLVRNALDDVGLIHTENMMPSELSGGMRKRIALARTLILKPSIILYDEPTTGLDPITAREIIHLMNHIRNKYGSTSMIISHDMNCVRNGSDRIIMLIDGKCYAQGTFNDLRNSTDENVKEFFEEQL